jgi:hypothetical protein
MYHRIGGIQRRSAPVSLLLLVSLRASSWIERYADLPGDGGGRSIAH